MNLVHGTPMGVFGHGPLRLWRHTMLMQELILALAKLVALFIIVSYIPRGWFNKVVTKHPFWCDLFCMTVIPLPLLMFGGVKGMAAAVFFALGTSVSIKCYRWYIQRPATTEHKARWWKIETANGSLAEHKPKGQWNDWLIGLAFAPVVFILLVIVGG